MSISKVPVPHLTTAYSGPLYHVEKIIINEIALIESWFRQQWKKTPAPLTSSVDLRQSGFKLAPVDTNLFPAGFNNLNPDFLPLCVQAAQSVMVDSIPNCTHILLLPENHTRNRFYMQSLKVLQTIFINAGYVVRIGSLDPELKESVTIDLDHNDSLVIEPLQKKDKLVSLANFKPCFLLLNNDLSQGIPDLIQDVNQLIQPPAQLGWATRLKSSHFSFFNQVVKEFAQVVNMDEWLINPYFSSIDGMDFMAQEGIDRLAVEVDKILDLTKKKYEAYEIREKPFVVIKADNGTYGMSVMMVHDAEELKTLNRKQRTKMSAVKGSQKVEKVLIQEGVYSFEYLEGAVAEPVVYMIGQFVVGGFYRVHQGRGTSDNLNAPGMHFEPLAFAKPCNMPCHELDVDEYPNRFYVYGVIARLAALAAAREIASIKDNQ